ncbi:hypothetical protein [uncultured Winogradskyella sp.]|uniref:hypothetical protein n=1 Tax=uncultured Winogradskyella sp. TaxID=395353 RepID=UPI002631707F|nr:hypothetical protein [uncultured Winogradskyella sp.]
MVYCLSNKYKTLFFLIFVVTISACKKEVKEEKKEELIVYQPSEMANLMNEFYEYNASLKSAILSNEDLEQMPERFLKIHSAEMTDSSGRNSIFNGFAPAYINSQMKVLDTLSRLDLRTRYNNNINMCLACHKTECVGPIPRIKKLLIK